MANAAKERRIHRVFVTRNTEYHMRRNKCVAVRDRRSGEWHADHQALCRTIAGALTFYENGGLTSSDKQPAVGDAMCFRGIHLVTSAVVSIERPEAEVVALYAETQTNPGLTAATTQTGY
jgi:hypothetical protein